MNFLAADRIDEIMALVKREVAQLPAVANHVRSQEHDQIVFLPIGILKLKRLPITGISERNGMPWFEALSWLESSPPITAVR